MGFLKEANRVTYWLGLPALLFTQLAGSIHGVSGATSMLGVMMAATLAVLALGYVVAWLMRVPGAVMGTFVQGAFRGNLAFVGLPIIYALPDVTLAGGISLRAAAVLTVAPMLVFFNVGGVVVLLLSQHRIGWGMLRPFLRQLATTPPLLASLAGIGCALAGWELPLVVNKTLGALGEMALPLGLLGVGGSLLTVRLGAAWRTPLIVALLKTVAAPVLGWVAGRALGLGAVELKTVLIFLATPSGGDFLHDGRRNEGRRAVGGGCDRVEYTHLVGGAGGDRGGILTGWARRGGRLLLGRNRSDPSQSST